MPLGFCLDLALAANDMCPPPSPAVNGSLVLSCEPDAADSCVDFFVFALQLFRASLSVLGWLAPPISFSSEVTFMLALPACTNRRQKKDEPQL